MHDIFDWWANIWVPALLGIATIAVAVVAVVISRNASRLARQLETTRIEDDRRRETGAAKSRLIELAVRDAQVLLRWTVEATQRRRGFHTTPVGGPPQPKTPLEVARTDAAVQLAISLVPGANPLLQITEFDLANRYEYLPDAGDRDDDPASLRRQSILRARDKRMFERIKSWGLDPEAQQTSIESDLRMADRDPENYLKIGYAGRG